MRKQAFFNYYNVLLNTEEDFCWCCINEIKDKINEKYKTNYEEEEIEEWLYKPIEQQDVELQFEHLGGI